MSDIVEDVKAPKKKGGLMKKLMIGVGLLVLVGGGVGAGLYASGAGLIGGGAHAESEAAGPKLVAKSDQKRASEAGGEGHGEEAASEGVGKPTPKGSGGDKFASNYYAMEKEFTSNLQDSVHFVQVGIAISTPYDDTVIDNLKTNEIAVRSAILMALGDTSEEQVFTVEGKTQLQRKLAKAINDTLKEKEGFGGVGNVYFTNFVVQ
ncbi:flagellar basal body-associated FliL family protein [Sphingomonas sp. So64.6b]|uniref:flagellar basal body-associated FliL family protein n=1 Tax=Sphingomonas sp. So64.6b TaxID=2997354 RepID=UPI0016001B49|nr:flagellar basal body-associated FliL family protein [Sphingomonas sp. So64.6b]QNA85749.1 flagellar basal body-associated FliL family protein [Sphingomonas sp. So64.6b]